MGEVYAISLAQTIGAYSLITDDTKRGGPYMSLLQLDYDIMPFTFADILILRYLTGVADEIQTVDDFQTINRASDLNWAFRSQISKFIKRFWSDPYKKEDKIWMQTLVAKYNVSFSSKLKSLSRFV